MNVFWIVFWILLGICLLLYFYTKQVLKTPDDSSFKAFQRVYLLVYLFAMGGDWLQGPYVYALYQHYGMSSHQIDILFVVGFGSSMFFGTIIGSSADKFGRRKICLLYAVLYSFSCITKHFGHFWILLIGRLLGGIATSILFSSFEAWVVCEHKKRGFRQDSLSILFSMATLGNSIVAITAGHVAQVVADLWGFVAPFDVAIVVLVFMALAVLMLWNENYGDSEIAFSTNFHNAALALKKDPKILSLGCVQALFEGSMYTFVLKWTPVLTPSSETPIPHGLIFASFMVSVMIGSFLFKILTKLTKIESFMRGVMLVAAISLAIPIFVTKGSYCILISFCVFEICVGLFWPSLGTMRGMYIPEEVRSTVMNFFRVPLNLIVISILSQNLSNTVVLSCCVFFLLAAAVAQHILYMLTLREGVVAEKDDEYVKLDSESA